MEGLTTPETYQEAVRDVKLFLEGRQTDLVALLARAHGRKPPSAQEYERAAKYRDLISTVEQLQEKQRIAGVEGDDADVFGYHYENGMLAVNLFHMRGGKCRSIDASSSGKTCRNLAQRGRVTTVERNPFPAERCLFLSGETGATHAEGLAYPDADLATNHVGTAGPDGPAAQSTANGPAAPRPADFDPGEFFSRS